MCGKEDENMSRIGRMPIAIPEGVSVTVDGNNLVTVTGKFGTLTQQVNKIIKVNISDKEISLTRPDDENKTKAMHGLYRMLIANMIEGVSKKFTKSIVINGVGYKASKSGNKLVLNIGFSHPVEVAEVDGITIDCPSATEVTISGISKEAVGQFAAKIRAIKPVEPYHAYGIKYKDEVVVRKQRKTSGKK